MVPEQIHHAKPQPEQGSNTKYRKKFVLKNQQLEEFSSRLKHIIDKEKVYTENEISLTQLSGKNRDPTLSVIRIDKQGIWRIVFRFYKSVQDQ